MKCMQWVKKWAFELKQNAIVLQVIYRDNRTPLSAKILIWLSLGYLFSPIDLIPDFIPILGLLDDFVIVPLLILLIIKLIPIDVYESAIKIKVEQSKMEWKKNWLIITFILLVWILLVYWSLKYGFQCLNELYQ